MVRIIMVKLTLVRGKQRQPIFQHDRTVKSVHSYQLCEENRQAYFRCKLDIDGIHCQIQDRTVAPYIENCIIIIGIDLGELFRGRELLLDLRVFKKFAYVVWERLKVRFQQLHIDDLAEHPPGRCIHPQADWGPQERRNR